MDFNIKDLILKIWDKLVALIKMVFEKEAKTEVE